MRTRRHGPRVAEGPFHDDIGTERTRRLLLLRIFVVGPVDGLLRGSGGSVVSWVVVVRLQNGSPRLSGFSRFLLERFGQFVVGLDYRFDVRFAVFA